MCLIVFVNCLAIQFAIFLGVVVIFLLNVMEVLSVGEFVWTSKECMCCACDSSEHLDTSSTCLFEFVYVTPHEFKS